MATLFHMERLITQTPLGDAWLHQPSPVAVLTVVPLAAPLFCCVVEDGMADLQELRARDSQRHVGPRLEAALRSWLPMVSNTVMSERPIPQVATAEAVEQQQEL